VTRVYFVGGPSDGRSEPGPIVDTIEAVRYTLDSAREVHLYECTDVLRPEGTNTRCGIYRYAGLKL